MSALKREVSGLNAITGFDIMHDPIVILDPDGNLQVFVQDTGIGIPEENMKKLFEPLFTTKAKGIGLGLSIVKTLVESHKGEISVESEVSKGATFMIQFPGPNGRT